jgi:hypothetical protein
VYPPDEPLGSDDALLAGILERLVLEPDPLVRLRTVTALASRLDWVRTMTVRQVMLGGLTDRRGDDAAARAAQVTGRAHLGQATYAWGRALGVAGQLADLAEDPGRQRRFRAEFDELVTVGLATPAAWSQLEEAAPRWRAAAHERDRAEAADALLRRLADLLSIAADLPDHLTMEERGEVALGYHHERVVARA